MHPPPPPLCGVTGRDWLVVGVLCPGNIERPYKDGNRLVTVLSFCVLATSKVISGWVPTCDRAQSWRLYSAAPPRDQAASNMAWCPTRSCYPVTEPTSPCPRLIMPNTRLGGDKYQFASHWFDSTRVQTHQFESDDLLKRI